ncbi:DUF6157 family protein [Azospirillum sp. TSO35-2]|uniref:DUF6157 family protein n=1 Tax=Azospirillum sp. TSO35-2 TaxID=716796 RepID=UPI000D603ED3|nr:DUF6157 family protein [Azospirillum sp. TSO35-2]PWC33960.1 hypothetical protein TSO352_26810 [Azospirillum sp. TSO35-2]
MSTNYRNTFIIVSADSRAEAGTTPTKPGTVASLQLALLLERPYAFTSDDLLFEVHALRNQIPQDARAEARAVFFAKPQACLRASPLVKSHGWGLHHDDAGKVAAYGVETDAYCALCERPDLTIVPGMRSRRG